MIWHLIIGLGAAWKVADIAGGSTVVIFGLGTVGLAVSSYHMHVQDFLAVPPSQEFFFPFMISL